MASQVTQDVFTKEITSAYTDVIGEKLGGKVLAFSDEWFAAAENLIKPNAPVREVGRFTPAGAWYDGWETRRHNEEEFDWVIIKIGVASARLIGAEIDTAFFNGNHAPAIAVDAAELDSDEQLSTVKWEEVIPKFECGPSQRHFFVRNGLTDKAYTHVRLKMYPDGGIARFRLYGKAVPVFPDANTPVDLASAQMGGIAVAFSDQHFGSADNLLLPGRGKDMSDGWETKRSRTPGHVDWVIVKLGAPALIEKVVVDTANFMGNFPQKVRIHTLSAPGLESAPSHIDSRWKEVVAPVKTKAHTEHEYTKANGILSITDTEPVTHVMMTIIPDGGVKRLRVFGTVAK